MKISKIQAIRDEDISEMSICLVRITILGPNQVIYFDYILDCRVESQSLA